MSITYLRSRRLFLKNKRKKLTGIASKNGLAMDIMDMDIDTVIMGMEDHHQKANRNVKEEALIGSLKNARGYLLCSEESLRTINNSLTKTKV